MSKDSSRLCQTLFMGGGLLQEDCVPEVSSTLRDLM